MELVKNTSHTLREVHKLLLFGILLYLVCNGLISLHFIKAWHILCLNLFRYVLIFYRAACHNSWYTGSHWAVHCWRHRHGDRQQWTLQHTASEKLLSYRHFRAQVGMWEQLVNITYIIRREAITYIIFIVCRAASFNE